MTDLRILVDRYNSLVANLKAEAEYQRRADQEHADLAVELKNLAANNVTAASALPGFVRAKERHANLACASVVEAKPHVEFVEALIARGERLGQLHLPRLQAAVQALESVHGAYSSANRRLEASNASIRELIRTRVEP